MAVIREFLNVTDQVVVTPLDASFIVQNATLSTLEVRITMKDKVLGTFINVGVTLQFVDGGVGNDTLVRDKGSWIDEQFDVGMILTISGSASNDGSTYTITAISDKTLTFATGTVTAEADATGVSITGNIPDTDWIVHETFGAGVDGFRYIENCGTGLRFVHGGSGVSNVWVRS